MGIVAFLLVCLISLLARVHFINTRPLAGRLDDQEPEAHILVTELAYEQIPWRVHHFLPLFTLGAPYNKNIDVHPDAESTDKYGNYYYTSTPPFTFVLPYFAAKLTVGAPTLIALRWYDVFLQILAAVTLGVLVWLCLGRPGIDPRVRALLTSTVAIIYMTAPECLKSHTITLWAQQFYAPLLMVQIICFLFYPSTLLLFIFAFLGCLSDWTPYVANSGMAAIAIFSWWKNRDRRSIWVAVAILAGCVLGGLCMIGWFSTEFSVASYFHDLAARSKARAMPPLVSTIKFFPLYLDSFGLFALVGLFFLFRKPWKQGIKNETPRSPVILPGIDPFVIAILIVAIALVENLLMRDHALFYSYDRLKGVQLLALLIAWAASRNYRDAVWAFVLCIVAGLASVGLFWVSYDTPGGWHYIATSQQERIGEVIAKTATEDGPAFFNNQVRGSEVYYANRDVFQHPDDFAIESGMDTVSYIRKWLEDHHFSEGTFYQINGVYPFFDPKDLPRKIRIRRIHTDGRVDEIGTVQLDEEASDYHPENSHIGLDPIFK